jgi:hypothetical protein
LPRSSKSRMESLFIFADRECGILLNGLELGS